MCIYHLRSGGTCLWQLGPQITMTVSTVPPFRVFDPFCVRVVSGNRSVIVFLSWDWTKQ